MNGYLKFSFASMTVAALIVAIIHFLLSGFDDALVSMAFIVPAAAGAIVYDMIKYFVTQSEHPR